MSGKLILAQYLHSENEKEEEELLLLFYIFFSFLATDGSVRRGRWWRLGLCGRNSSDSDARKKKQGGSTTSPMNLEQRLLDKIRVETAVFIFKKWNKSSSGIS